MPDTPDESSAPTASEKLQALVAQRKAAGGRGPAGGAPGQRRAERAAAALSASKSKPAPRK